MTDQYAEATAATESIRSLTMLQPMLGIILGSGLGNFASQVENPTTISYAEIPHFPQSTVEGHSGKLILGTINKISVAVMQGRVHAYEGYSMAQVAFPTRVLGLLGVRKLIVTNAAGGINRRYGQGAIVAISDHINLTGANAALGPNEPRFAITRGAGQRFFDMSSAYSSALRKLATKEAAKQGWTLNEGVYLAVLGPSYETPAEIRFLRTIGADLVGMSTVPEVIVANHIGIRCVAISCVTNMAAGILPQKINHQEVLDTGARVRDTLVRLLKALLPRLPQ